MTRLSETHGRINAEIAQEKAVALGRAVERIVREVAREIVPGVAERLIREEIRRLRQEHGLAEPPD